MPVLGMALLLPFFSAPALAEVYFQQPKLCQTLTNSEQQPGNPFRFLSLIAQNQVPTPSCGFHAGAILLEALVNSQDPSILAADQFDMALTRSSLSIIDCMQQLGICTQAQFESASISIENGAAIKTRNALGFTPLNKAADRGHLETVKYLLVNKANLEEANMGGFTPLAQAVFSGRYNVVKYLIDQGANPLAVGNDGRSILDLAKSPSKSANKGNQKGIFNAIANYIIKYNKVQRRLKLKEKGLPL